MHVAYVSLRPLDINCISANLRSLCFRLDGYYTTALDWLRDCLSIVSPINRVEKVVISFPSLMAPPFDEEGWAPIDAILASWTSCSLSYVSLKFRGSTQPLPLSAITAFLRHSIPNLVSKEIAEVHWGNVILPSLLVFDPNSFGHLETPEGREPILSRKLFL
jgi:hypothetical protein